MAISQFRHFAETRPPLRPVPEQSATHFRSVRRDNAAPRLVACVDDGEQANAVSAQALAIACS
ncbi:unnamed protein product, partial [Laminaria digitata]